jgi:hypothetical protein
MEWNGGERGWGGEEERSLSRGWRDEIGVVDTGDQCDARGVANATSKSNLASVVVS